MDDKTFDQKNAEDWIGSIEGSPTRDKDIYPWLRDWVNRTGAVDILDLGCGQGICADKLELENKRYTGMDPSPFLIERAQQLYPAANRRFVPGNVYELPFEAGAFDAVFSVAVWHLLSSIKKAGNELSRVLRPKGHFVIVTANPGAYHKWTDRYKDGRTEGKRFEGTTSADLQDVLYLHTLGELMHSLDMAKLVVKKSEIFRSGQFVWIEGHKAT